MGQTIGKACLEGKIKSSIFGYIKLIDTPMGYLLSESTDKQSIFILPSLIRDLLSFSWAYFLASLEA